MSTAAVRGTTETSADAPKQDKILEPREHHNQEREHDHHAEQQKLPTFHQTPLKQHAIQEPREHHQQERELDQDQLEERKSLQTP